MITSRFCAGLLLAASAWLLSGCATPPRPDRPASATEALWTGRMALQVEDNAGQSFSGGFQLRGTAAAGELTLYSPLGGTLAVLTWSPGSAQLRGSNGQVREFASVEALAAEATGAPIPVGALFDWLSGVNTPVSGWQPDLSQLAQGRLRARRVDPPPAADLRVAFER